MFHKADILGVCFYCWQMSIVMIVMFLVAWSPYSMVCLWASFGDPKTIPAPMAIIAPLFAKSSTFYNPCIYVIANKKWVRPSWAHVSRWEGFALRPIKSFFPHRFRRAIIGMIRCQTRQRITISTQVPMTISQQPLTQWNSNVSLLNFVNKCCVVNVLLSAVALLSNAL